MSNKTIIDVRSPQEFSGGHVAGSINIPLNEVPDREAEISEYPKPIILCCLSGHRSGQAADFLNQKGIECSNGGGWMELNQLLLKETI